MALVAFFLQKKNGASTSKALLGAAVAGAGTYYVATETDWGRANLGAIDKTVDSWFNPETGETITEQSEVTPLLDAEGKQQYDSKGNALYQRPSKPATQKEDGSWVNTLIRGTAGTLQSWGGAGTAAVVGTTAVATSSSLQKYLPWIIGGAAIILLAK